MDQSMFLILIHVQVLKNSNITQGLILKARNIKELLQLIAYRQIKRSILPKTLYLADVQMVITIYYILIIYLYFGLKG